MRRVLVAAGLLATAGALHALDAVALIRRVETQHRGRTSRGRAVMRVQTADWARTLTLDVWGRGREDFVVKIRAPQKEAGTATLKKGGEVWNYFPKIDRLIKIPSSLMGDSWMGSHFTNDDLVKEDKVEELYDLSIASRSAGRAWIEARPKPDAPVVWGRLVYDVDLERVVPRSVDYFDEKGVLVRQVLFDRVARVGERWVPLRMRVVPVDKPEESTEIVYETLAFDEPMPADRFSLGFLRRP